MVSGALPSGEGLHWTGSDTNWQLCYDHPLEEVMKRLATLPLAGVRDDGGSLEDLFDRLYEAAAEEAS